MARKISFLTSIIISVLALTAITAAVLPSAVWQNGLDSLTMVKGSSAFFNVAVITSTPPQDVSINLVNSNGAVLRNFGSFNDPSGWFTLTITVNPSDYNNLGGTFYIRVSASDSSGDSDLATLVLIVTQQAPVISNIPDVTMNAGDSLQAFDLDGYVSDADDSIASLGWSVTGNNSNVLVTIAANNVVTINANSSFTGTRVLTFTVVDPSGATATDTVTVTVQPAGSLLLSDSDGDVTIHSLNFEVVDGSYLLIRNKGSNLDELRVSLEIEAAGSTEQVWTMNLNRNTVTYKKLDIESLGLESGAYLARLEVSSGDDDFKESAYLVAEL